MTWYEMDPSRLVLEHLRVVRRYPSFKLYKKDSTLFWEGVVEVSVAGLPVDPFRISVSYPDTFPIRPPRVTVLEPVLDPQHVGHDWHRYIDGSLCYVESKDWTIEPTADEVISKSVDWYYNYMAVARGLIDKMPDIGRAQI
jgi:ubiquitin-protein ligase